MHTSIFRAVARTVRPTVHAASSLVLSNTKASSVRLLSWDAQPSPPRLPPDQQAEFEQLVREAQESAAAASLADAMKDAVALSNARAKAVAAAELEDERNEAALKAEATPPSSNSSKSPTAGLNGNPIEGVWRGAPPEFEGERNPRTGEVGGPKNEPLRWGAAGDWSYNGRVTDF